MPKLNYQSKIVVSLLVFLLLAGILFGVGFPWLLAKDGERQTAILDQKRTVLELRQEQRNIELAKQDIETLHSKSIVPENFFGKDTTLVSELGHLEAEAKKHNVLLSLSVSGTVGAATKAKTTSELYVIPFSMRLTGVYTDVVAYMDFLEHADTIFTVRTVSFGSATENTVSAGLAGTIYLRK